MQRQVHTKLHPILLAVLATTALCGCGDTEPTPRVVIDWEAGDIDRFGCPYVDPEPWASEDVHQATCGDGCQPVGLGSDFVACFGAGIMEFLPNPEFTTSPASICIRHPVSGEGYQTSNVQEAGPFLALCWPGCGAADPPTPEQLHDWCSEDVPDAPP